MKVLVVGYGNTLRSDDGFGPAVVRELQGRVDAAQVRVLEQQLLTLDLIDAVANCRLLVLVDAAATGNAGELGEREISAGNANTGALGHDLSPEQLLALSRELMGSQPRCLMLSTLPLSMELGETLSPEVAAVVPLAVERVLDLSLQSA